MIEKQIIKLLLEKNFYNKYKGHIASSVFEGSYGSLFSTIEKAHEEYEEDISLDDLYSLHTTKYNPALTRAMKISISELIEDIREVEKPNNKIVGYLAYLNLKTGFEASLYMSEEDIEKHASRFSKMYQYDKKNNKKSSKWSDPESRLKMSLKTVLKGLLGTYGVVTTEIAKAFSSDNETEETTSSRNIQDAEIIPQSEEPKNKKVEI